MKRGMFYVAVCSLLLMGMSAWVCGDTGEGAQVKIDNFSFVPAALTVKAGTTVTWVNRDDSPHTVVGTRKEFSSPVMDTDGTYAHTFTAPGSYDYYCSVHPHMKGRVVVQ